MLFTSPIFLYLFLPILLGCYVICPRRLKNGLLLVASLIFYTWGELHYAWVFLLSMAMNYFFGLMISYYRNSRTLHILLGFACISNLALLAYFKYFNFLIENAVTLACHLGFCHYAPKLDPIHLPIGISFFTFHALSYLIDVARGTSPVQKKPWDLALYLALFPQLIAGPIIRYHDIADQITNRRMTLENAYQGTRRFLFGLAKKLLIANPLGLVADSIFSIPGDELTQPLAWLGIICYTLQLYFDFSAYSCMAIGLGRIFGFHFLENFNYPYVARSVQDFWRRWHISLSRWFRDYLYIPLGGNRKGAVHTYINLYIVFFLCGLWHGASWNFVIWGMFHGTFLCIERAGLEKILEKTWRPVAHIYTILQVMIAWVFFRTDSLPHALQFIKAMAGLGANSSPHYSASYYFNPELMIILPIAILFSLPLWPKVERILDQAHSDQASAKMKSFFLTLAGAAWSSIIFAWCVLAVNANSYNPFIYFRF